MEYAKIKFTGTILGKGASAKVLEATYLDLGAVWLGVATADSCVTYVKELFNLPENIKPFALISVGYPDNQKNEFVDRYNEAKVHYEKWAK